MEKTQQKNSRICTVIIVLAVLLALSVAALSGILIWRQISSATSSTVKVPDNIITNSSLESSSVSQVSSEISEESSEYTPSSSDSEKFATVLSLHSNNYGDNLPFNVGNMFPGDMYRQYYCVRVTYQDRVTLHFSADILDGYEKLAEAMRVQIRVLGESSLLYDGLMKDIPDSVGYSLSSREVTTDEVYFEISPYLPTNVSNEYQNKTLNADFHWWVEETGNLKPAPPMGGDSTGVLVCTAAVLGSMCGLIFLYPLRRKEKSNAK